MPDTTTSAAGTEAPRAEPAAPARRTGRRPLPAWLIYMLSFVTIFGLWHVMATHVSPSPLFSPPLPVLHRMQSLAASGALFQDIGISLQRIMLGFIAGSAVGVLCGLLMGASRTIRLFFEPYVNFFRFIPGIAMITVAVIWFGIGEFSKVFLILYTTVFIVIINTMVGVLSIPQNKIRAAQCLGASRRQVFLHVSIPATMPYVLTGMRLAMANSFATIVSAEMLAADSGIGTVIWTARLLMQVEDVYVALVVLGVLGFLTDRLFASLAARYAGKYGAVG